MLDIHDIRPPVSWGGDPVWKQYGLYLLAGVVLIAALVWAFLMWRKWRNKTLDIETLVPELSPEDWARQALDDIRGLMETCPKTYYFGLSEVLRGYIEKRFSLPALEMTSEELIPRLPDLNLDAGLNREIREFLKLSDLVKFADASTSRAGMQSHDQWVLDFVDLTTPVIEIPEPPPSRVSDPGHTAQSHGVGAKG
jgi:hypothetical protein